MYHAQSEVHTHTPSVCSEASLVVSSVQSIVYSWSFEDSTPKGGKDIQAIQAFQSKSNDKISSPVFEFESLLSRFSAKFSFFFLQDKSYDKYSDQKNVSHFQSSEGAPP